MIRVATIVSAVIALVGLACAVPTISPAGSRPECVPSPVPESRSCSYRTTIVLAVGQTRRINPAFFDVGNRPALAPDNLEWQFGPADIGTVLPIFGTSSADIRGDAVGAGTLQLIDVATGTVLATADVCVFDPGTGPWSIEAVRAELVLE